jgi:hypothetical protein
MVPTGRVMLPFAPRSKELFSFLQTRVRGRGLDIAASIRSKSLVFLFFTKRAAKYVTEKARVFFFEKKNQKTFVL